jgi:hypothetical protein
MALTNTAIRAHTPGAKPVKLFEQGGLFLVVTPAGGKWWRLKYPFDGKEKLSSSAPPDTSLAMAREKRDEARRLLAGGVDPSAHKQGAKAARGDANSFETVARKWFAKFSPRSVPSHADKIIRRLERDVFPWIGSEPVGEVTAPKLLTTMRRIEHRGAIETAHRALQNCGQVFRYAVATGRAERDPSGDLRGALPPVAPRHHASITDSKAIGQLLRDIGPKKARSSPAARSSSRRSCSCGQASFAKPNGQRWTSKRQSGASPPQG